MKHAIFCGYWNEKIISIIEEHGTIDYWEEGEMHARMKRYTRGKTMNYPEFSAAFDKIAGKLYT